jgi:hypothetical protein
LAYAALLFGVTGTGQPLSCLRLVGTDIHFYEEEPPLSLGWRAGAPQANNLAVPPLAWLREPGGAVELAAVDDAAVVHWARIDFDYKLARHSVQLNLAAGHEKFQAVTLLRPGHIAAVAADGVYWLRVRGGKLVPLVLTEVALSGVLACFVSPRTNELLVLRALHEVEVVRVPILTI